MSLNIKNDRAHQLARQLAATTGETLTEAVTVALQERVDRLRHGTSTEQRAARILELGRSIAASLPADGLSPEDLYDPRTGLPA